VSDYKLNVMKQCVVLNLKNRYDQVSHFVPIIFDIVILMFC